jgi:hypothetical protein
MKKMIRFIRIQKLEEYLDQGWVLVKCGTEMAAVRKV